MMMPSIMQVYSFKSIFNKNLLNQFTIHINLRFALVVFCTILFNPSAHAEDSSDAPENTLEAFTQPKTAVKSDIELVNRPLIAGLWGMTIPNATCIEYYNFKLNFIKAIK